MVFSVSYSIILKGRSSAKTNSFRYRLSVRKQKIQCITNA